jgi:hypothetical protein
MDKKKKNTKRDKKNIDKQKDKKTKRSCSILLIKLTDDDATHSRRIEYPSQFVTEAYTASHTIPTILVCSNTKQQKRPNRYRR